MQNLPAKILDRNSEFRGVPTRKLMENAGKEAAAEILRKFGKPQKVQIFCGSGGNGGDGLAAAGEFLRQKILVEVILVSAIRNQDAQFFLRKLPPRILKKWSPKILIDGTILIDAILGVGVKGKLKKLISDIVAKLKQSKAKIVSLDVPTGKLKPKLIIAFHSSKNSKNEIVVPIGIPKIAETHFGPGDVEFYFPRRKLDSHKGENGRVVIIGGSLEFVGAPLFAGLGSIAGGVDLVDIFVPKINFAASRKFSPNFLIHEISGEPNFLTPEAAVEILEFARKNKATIILGCGLGKNIETKKAILEIVKKTTQPLVLDADAIISELITLTLNPNTILTPHAGEWRRIPKNLNATILKKGRIDEIISPDGRKRWNDQGNPILTVGGTGDVLAGVVGGLLARKVEPFEAAGIGAFLVGLAGEKIAVKSESATPQMLAKKIPKIIREIFDQKF